MRILYHHRTRGEDAQGIHVNALCEAFRELGHQVQLVAPASGHRPRPREAAARKKNSVLGIAIPHLLYEVMAIGYNALSLVMLALAAVRFRPDFIYERYALLAISGRVVARLFGVPFVLEVNAPLSVELQTYDRLVLRRLARRAEDWLCRSADLTVVVSGPMKAMLVSRGAAPERVAVVPNGVDRRLFHPAVSGESVRRALGLDGRYVVGFVGWMRPWHGVDLMIRALARLRDQLPALRLLIVGDGPALPGLRDLAVELGVGERVHLTGAVPSHEVPRYVAAMDVAVQPDVTAYASPIKLFEYLAMAKPVIAPRRDNIVEVVEDAVHALLFTPGDALELADCIRRLGLDSRLRSALGTAALLLVEERGYYWTRNAERVVAFVRDRRGGGLPRHLGAHAND